MKNVFLLLLFCQAASPVKHSLTTSFTGSTGLPGIPEFVGVVMVDDIEVIYCDSNIKRAEPRHDWMIFATADDPKLMDWYTAECQADQHFFRSLIDQFNHIGGVHILQRRFGCEWDDEIGEFNGFNLYGYDGEDFIEFDLKTDTWIAPISQAVTTKNMWDNDNVGIENTTPLLTQLCPEWLKKYLDHGNNTLLRTEPPSVSLLQKSPSSPVSCHATGFYPDRAVMFWRRDGEELHEFEYAYEYMDHREILPNHDGTFQMAVDLELSSVTPEDWWMYECVFQLFGVEDSIVTRLDKAVIRTNWEEHSLKFLFTGSTGVTNFPEFVGVVMVDGVEVVYCDSSMERAEPKQEWMKKLMEDDPKHMDWYTDECHVSQRLFSSTIESLKQLCNNTGGVHTLQRIYGCEWEKSFDKYGYDGEDLLRFDLTWKSWFPSKHSQALNTKRIWDRDNARIKNITFHLTQRCPDWLNKYLDYGKSSLKRTELPSVSLLQKSPFSPVSCHATGFYPDRAVMFWRRDGEELDEYPYGFEYEYAYEERGEILHNHDGTFQMSADLKISSVPPEDWKRYDCVFQLSGLKEDIVTKLDKAVIKTNMEPPSVSLLQKSPSSPVSCHATGFYPDSAVMLWRKDGEELHEDVDLGEILPNHDGTFQMSVDLNLSSVAPEDWRRYDCVFQLSGVKNNIVTRLDEAVIRTNWGSPSGFSTGPVIGGVVGLLLLSVCIAGLFMWRRNNSGFRLANRGQERLEEEAELR